MKKINVKKVSGYLNSTSNFEMKPFVQDCVNAMLNDEKPNPAKIQFLDDLGLLIEA